MVWLNGQLGRKKLAEGSSHEKLQGCHPSACFSGFPIFNKMWDQILIGSGEGWTLQVLMACLLMKELTASMSTPTCCFGIS